MNRFDWTKDQENAIKARGGTLLVSAAAGSGKTAVLTQRVVGLIDDDRNPCSIDELLIVTFTRAAAGEMREKIADALRERIKEKPDSVHLKNQLMLLPIAEICTMDSFCSRIVKENYHLCGIAPDFKLLSDSDEKLMFNLAGEQTLEDLYSEGGDASAELRSLFLGDKDDSAFITAIINLSRCARSYPSPEAWLDSLTVNYNPEISLCDTEWYEVIVKNARQLLSYADSLCDKIEYAMGDDEQLKSKFSVVLNGDRAIVATLNNRLDNKDWDGFINALRSVEFEKISSKRCDNTDVADIIKNSRDKIKKAIKKLQEFELPNLAEHTEDMRVLAPVANKLVEAVKLFWQKLSVLKEESNTYGFDDIIHMTLGLLFDEEHEKTELALSLAEKYREILIDEYQDTNEAQDMLFYSVSRDGNNLFYVGDVKQSIYRFRQAMPEIFLEKKEKIPMYDGIHYPAQIILDRNFRSRSGIAGGVNLVFSQIMSKELGELEYTEDEHLVPAAEYPPSIYPDTELHFLSTPKGCSAAKCAQYEAKYIAEYISGILSEKVPVKRKNGMDVARPGDFCILVRSKKNAVHLYNALNRCGLDASAPLDTPFFQEREVSFILSLLRVIDNPLLDVPLCAVMLFPPFGFTAEALAELRITERKAPLYRALAAKSAEGDENATRMLNTLEGYRFAALSMAPDELVRHVISDTGLLAITRAMSNSAQRRRNVLSLVKLAEDYTASGGGSLGGFVRYLMRLRDGAVFSPPDSGDSGDNCVKIMTIHKSKGLEYPFVVLADCSREFSNMSKRGALIISRSVGIGLIRRDIDKLGKIRTAPYVAASMSIDYSELSEEMRLLYVAMTRAKERFAAVCTASEGKLFTVDADDFCADGKINPRAVRDAVNYKEYLMLAFMRHKDAGVLRDMCSCNRIPLLNNDFNASIILSSPKEPEKAAEIVEVAPELDPVLEEELLKRVEYVYPYSGLAEARSKRAASSLASAHGEDGEFSPSAPSFANKVLTGAGRGTAFHRFFELCDLGPARDDARKEAERLFNSARLSSDELEALDFGSISAFLNSDLGNRMLMSSKVEREYKFSVFRNAGELYPELPAELAEERIVVEGIADCMFYEDGEIVIVDYKTDRVKSIGELAEKYRGQLEMYRSAVEECEGAGVRECIIYSLHLSEWIRLT